MVGLLVSVIFDAPFLRRLNDPSIGRGLITWVILLSAIGIAMVLIYQAFSVTGDKDEADNRFRRAREIFATLMGILGTIVGFYFGSAEKAPTKMDVAEIKILDKKLVTHATGGTLPYRFTVKVGDVTIMKDRSSDDGWIVEPLDSKFKLNASIVVDVLDAKDNKATKKSTVIEEKPTTPEPSEPPKAEPPKPGPAESERGKSEPPKSTPPAPEQPKTGQGGSAQTSAKTPKTPSRTRREGSKRTANRSKRSTPRTNSRRASERLAPSPRARRHDEFAGRR